MHIKKLIIMALFPMFAAQAEYGIEADVLYWGAAGSNINYVADYDQAYIDNTVLVKSYNKSLDPYFNVGFRVGGCYCLPFSCWDVGFLWTSYQTDACGCTCSLNKTFEIKSDYDVKADWKLDLDYWDLRFSRDLTSYKCLQTTAFLGIRGLRVGERYRSNSGFVQLDSFSILAIRENYTFYGAGPRVGVDVDVDLGCGFGLYGRAAVAGIVGFSKNCIKGARLSGSTIYEEPSVSVDCKEQNVQANRAMTDMSFGVSFETNLSIPFVFTLGVEHHAIFGQKDALYGRGFVIAPPIEITFVDDPETATMQILPPADAGKCYSTLATYGLVVSVKACF